MSTTRTNSSFFLGAVAALVVALAAAMGALLVLAYNANPAQAAGVCSTTSGTTTCKYGSTGGEQTFVVPAGVSSVKVVATGALGAEAFVFDGYVPAPPGRGARVSGNLTGLETGDTLFVNVGSAPTVSDDCLPTVNCIGGFNGGGDSGELTGGGGGGASDVRYLSWDRSGSLASRLIVAAGGGGSGIPGNCNTLISGGSGGAAGSDGGDGESCNGPDSTIDGGEGGKAGTQTAGGAGGGGG